jgi:predicted thioesterase
MRPGPPRGEHVARTITVTPAMTARVAGREIHPVYGTGALVAHVEALCRSLLEPHLEPHEEGVGTALELVYRAPVPVGEPVELVATVAAVGPHRLVCEVLARHRGSVVARGSFEQRVVDRVAFAAEIAARRAPGPAPGPVADAGEPSGQGRP